MAKYYLPGIGGQVEQKDGPYQSSPLLNTYSPRLLGAPAQLTHLNDMRLLSSNPDQDNTPGPVGDFYLTKILQDAQVANIVVGKALFTGGMSSLANIIRIAGQYAYALNKYDVFDSGGTSVDTKSTSQKVLEEANMTTYKQAMEDTSESASFTTYTTAGALGLSDLDEDASVGDISSLGSATSIIENLGNIISAAGGTLASALLTSLSVQQPFYTFESDWSSYINNVKMFINTAVIMLGLQKACVRIGDDYYPIGVNANVTADNDVWSNYRFITPSTQLGDVTAIDNQSGDTTQYVSFMISPEATSETYTNEIGESSVYGVVNKGSDVGSEISFLTNASANSVDDAVLDIASGAVSAAETVLSSLTAGAGRFTAAIAGSMARSYIGDHTIYPKVFKGHESYSDGITLKVKLRCSGNPYSYLTDMIVPLAFILNLVIPQMSKNNASAYSFPPLIQCNVPGVWGTRLGMVESVTVNKNPNGNDFSVNGYPLAADIDIKVKDLQNVLTSSPMNKVSTLLNNHTMFDYIAQCAGVDKYRVNGSIRLATRLTLAASAVTNSFNNLGDALLNDFTSFANRLTGTYRM